METLIEYGINRYVHELTHERKYAVTVRNTWKRVSPMFLTEVEALAYKQMLEAGPAPTPVEVPVNSMS